MGTAIQADLTVTFGNPKIGLYVGDAINLVGHIEVVDIGIPIEYVQKLKPQSHLLTPELVSPLIPPRPQSAHKGSHSGMLALSLDPLGRLVQQPWLPLEQSGQEPVSSLRLLLKQSPLL